MLTKVIPSYLYVQYNDDPDLKALLKAYNNYAQEYVDWFNTINLPVYTGAPIAGALLDWVLTGLYGLPRPVLPSGKAQAEGPYNTVVYNRIAYNSYRLIGPSEVFATTDDVYKRIATWDLYRGDGTVFTIRWLKRRIMRFLTGPNGTDPGVNQTYQISVTFGVGNVVSIQIRNGIRTIKGGAIFNRFAYNRQPYNALQSTFEPLPGFGLAPILKSAIESGAVELPFQFTYIVSI